MRKFIFICLALAAFAAPALADEPAHDFPLNCTRGSAPLKTCLVEEIVDHVEIGQTSDEISISALHRIVGVVAEHGSTDQRKKLLDNLIDQFSATSIKSWENMRTFSEIAHDIGDYGTETQIQRTLKINDSISDDLHWQPFPPVQSYNHSAEAEKLSNHLYLQLAAGDQEAVEATLKQLTHHNSFEFQPDLEQMAILLIKRDKPYMALKFIQNVRNFYYNDYETVGGAGNTPPSPIYFLTLSLLERQDFASASKAKKLCGHVLRYNSNCLYFQRNDWVRDKRDYCIIFKKVFDDPQFLNWIIESWFHKNEMAFGLDFSTSLKFKNNGMYYAAWGAMTSPGSICAEKFPDIIKRASSASIDGARKKEFLRFLQSTQDDMQRSSEKLHQENCTGTHGIEALLQCKCKEGDFDCSRKTILLWIKGAGARDRDARDGTYQLQEKKVDVYELIRPLKTIYSVYKEAGEASHFQEILAQIPPPDHDSYKEPDSYGRKVSNLKEAVTFFNEIGDKDRQAEAEKLLFGMHVISDLKKAELLNQLSSNNPDKALDYLQTVPIALEWILSQNLSDDVKKKAFERFWPDYVTNEQKADKALLEYAATHNDYYRTRKDSVAGMKDALWIAKLLDTRSDDDILSDKYPEGLALLKKMTLANMH